MRSTASRRWPRWATCTCQHGGTTMPERRYFNKGPQGSHRHLHMVELGGAFWQSHLLFRDYLRTHPETAAAYAALKREPGRALRPRPRGLHRRQDGVHSVGGASSGAHTADSGPVLSRLTPGQSSLRGASCATKQSRRTLAEEIASHRTLAMTVSGLCTGQVSGLSRLDI